MADICPREKEFGELTGRVRAALLAVAHASATHTAVLVIAKTGFTGRELYTLGDAASQRYLFGAMGSASGVGLGLALLRPEPRLIVVDGTALYSRAWAISRWSERTRREICCTSCSTTNSTTRRLRRRR